MVNYGLLFDKLWATNSKINMLKPSKVEKYKLFDKLLEMDKYWV